MCTAAHWGTCLYVRPKQSRSQWDTASVPQLCFPRQPQRLVTHSLDPLCTCPCTLVCAHTSALAFLAVSLSQPLHLPPWRDPFSEWKTCLDVSEIYISAHTRGASLLRLKEVKGEKKEMNFKVYRHVLSQYPALWPCLIYEAASFIFSPVVYQPHETSTRTSFLTTYTEMFSLTPLYALTHTHRQTHTTGCHHYNTGMFDEQYCQQVRGKKGTNVWVIGIEPLFLSLTTKTHK